MGRIWRVIKAGLWAGQAFVVMVSLYQTAITALGYWKQKHPTPKSAAGRLPRLGIIVCARSEASVGGRLVRDLLDQEYPPELREVLVVAHNCADDTASIAARAGASVIELRTTQPGKKYAVQAGIEAF